MKVWCVGDWDEEDMVFCIKGFIIKSGRKRWIWLILSKGRINKMVDKRNTVKLLRSKLEEFFGWVKNSLGKMMVVDFYEEDK